MNPGVAKFVNAWQQSFMLQSGHVTVIMAGHVTVIMAGHVTIIMAGHVTIIMAAGGSASCCRQATWRSSWLQWAVLHVAGRPVTVIMAGHVAVIMAAVGSGHWALHGHAR